MVDGEEDIGQGVDMPLSYWVYCVEPTSRQQFLAQTPSYFQGALP